MKYWKQASDFWRVFASHSTGGVLQKIIPEVSLAIFTDGETLCSGVASALEFTI